MQRVESLPTRYLPPGSVKMLYVEFSQSVQGISSLGSTFQPQYKILIFDASCFNVLRPKPLLHSLKVHDVLATLQNCLGQHTPLFGSINTWLLWHLPGLQEAVQNMHGTSPFPRKKHFIAFSWLDLCSVRFAISKDAQSKYETARGYKQHLDLVQRDRQLEEFFEAVWYNVSTFDAPYHLLQAQNPLEDATCPLTAHWATWQV